MTGVIVRAYPERGYGFLASDDGQELFFHRFDCQDLDEFPSKGKRVSFEMGVFNGRPKAVNLRPVAVRS